MKRTKKLIAIVLSCIFALSCFGMSAYAVQTSEDAVTVNIQVTPPSAGSSPSGVSCLSQAINLTYVYWAQKAPDEGAYHIMSANDTFKSGYRYRIYVEYDCVSTTASNINITFNGNPATSQSDSFMHGEAYYDFGTLSGSSGGFGFFDIILSILGIPLYILIIPFSLITLLFGL